MLLIAGYSLFAQPSQEVNDPKALKDAKYRRSSLHTILLESEAFPKKDEVMKAYNSSPFPDKYDNHNIGEKSFNPAAYAVTDEERAVTGQKKGDEDMPYVIAKYFKQNKTANKVVSKWFNRQADGSFDDLLVSERGLINASYLENKTAAASSDGIALMKTAGFELLNNTFVVVNQMKFYENEPVVRGIRDAALIAANEISNELIKMGAIKVAEKAYEKGKEGYSVWTTSYLYKLKWDKEVETTFFTDFWIDKSSMDATKKANFDNSDLFQLEFVGSEKCSSLVTFSLTQKRTEDQIINLSVTRNVDNVYAKLQKTYDVFKTKVPLYSGNPLTAKIGMKEGLEGGEKFEVLEAVMDPKTGLIEYKKKGIIKVEKKSIWDNRYTDSVVEAGEEAKPAIDVTTFSGGDKYYSGMLIRQIK